MFRPEKGVYIDCFINNIYINYLILRRKIFNERTQKFSNSNRKACKE